MSLYQGHFRELHTERKAEDLFRKQVLLVYGHYIKGGIDYQIVKELTMLNYGFTVMALPDTFYITASHLIIYN